MRNDRPASMPSAYSDSIRLLHECRDKATAQLMRALQGMLDKVDDTLFDLAEKSESNALQSAYFDAMREVRLRRQQMEEDFRRQLLASYRSNVQSDFKAEDGDQSDDAALPDLMLLDNDDLEESLAITNMVTKLEAIASEELFALDKRVGFLLHDADLTRHQNPFGPKVICDAARQACRQVESGIEVKLIILKLFDRLVVGAVPAIYGDLNEHLVQASILPHVCRTMASKKPAPRGTAAGVAKRSTAMQDTAESGPPKIQDQGPGGGVRPATAALSSDGAEAVAPDDLLAALRCIMMANGADQGSLGVAGQSEELRRMLGALTLIQQGHTEPLKESREQSQEIAVVGDMGNVLRQVKTARIATGIGHFDDMMIDIVAMMFDYILDDKNLADSIKALIARLQIPILKVAIVDKSFFARKFHPARKLLNTIAGAAIGWSEKDNHNDTLYEKIEAIVHCVLSEFDDDPSIFSLLLQDFEHYLSQQEHLSEASSLKSAEIVESRERLQAARNAAQNEVARRVSGDDVPEVIGDFLNTYWKELLIVSCVDGGEQGDEWKRHVKTMDDLVWSVTPKRTPKERFKLVGLLPGLVKRLNEGMMSASMDLRMRDRFIAELADYHAKAVKPSVEERAATAVRKHDTATSDQPTAIAPTSPRPNEKRAKLSTLISEPFLHGNAGGSHILEGAKTDCALAIRLVHSAILKANGLIFRTAQRQPQCKGMGTTLVAALFTENRMIIAHVGDSRLYRLRNNELHQLTVDHSLQQELIEKGFYTPEEARKSVNKNIVTRAIGVEPTVKPDLKEEVVQDGDVFLLCSDGLSDLVTEQEIRSILKQFEKDLETAAEVLVNSANDKGGKDNISVVLARILALSNSDSLNHFSKMTSRNIQIVTRSDVGRKRSHNEDSVRADSEIGIAVLADGMGGYNAGEVASAIAVNLIAAELRKGLRGTAIPDCDDEQAQRQNQWDLHRDERVEDGRYLRELLGRGMIEVEEITVQDVHERPNDGELLDEYTHLARNLEIGSWVEFRRPGEAVVRARLSWISSATGAYLFTDRQGLKVADSTVHGLAVELRRGTARVIEDIPLFDRAVSSVMERLKQSGSSTSG